jgi:SOS-response transcriptional repressor LexA
MTHSVFHIPIPLLGTIEAGWPSPAEEELTDTITLDDWLTPNKEGTIRLKAPNNAMFSAGILAGDLVLLDRSLTPQDGAIVLAEVDGRTVLRRFLKRGRKVYLESANPHYPPIVPEEHLTVTAVVTAVIRKY